MQHRYCQQKKRVDWEEIGAMFQRHHEIRLKVPRCRCDRNDISNQVITIVRIAPIEPLVYIIPFLQKINHEIADAQVMY